MARYYRRKPLPVDGEKSWQWAISSLGSVGLAVVDSQLFDLVNRTTGRAHRLEFNGKGVAIAPVFTGSIGHSDYVNFQTKNPVSFHDFNGLWMTIRETNALFWSWTTISFWGMSVLISDGGLNSPGLGVMMGHAKVLFSDGSAVGTPEIIATGPRVREKISAEEGKWHAKEDDAGLTIPGDFLFAFNQHRLAPGPRTEWALGELYDKMRLMHEDRDYGFFIDGHTDAVGSLAYNMELSKKRADTVAGWMKKNVFPRSDLLKTRGFGPTDPVASNDTEEGRAKNRRVVVHGIPYEMWKKW